MRSTVDLISERIYGIYTFVTCELNLLFWRLDGVYFREKNELIFYALAGPVKKMAIRQHDLRHKFAELHNYKHKIPKRFTQPD